MLGIGACGPRGTAPTTDRDPVTAGTDPGPLSVAEAGPTGETSAAVGPPDDEERDAWVVLSRVHGVGPVSFERLVRRFGTVTAVLARARRGRAIPVLVEASIGDDGSAPTLSPAAAAALVAAARQPGAQLASVRRSGVAIVTLADEAYPARLRRIDLPPPVLYLRGDIAALDRTRAIAIVGTRRPTDAGRSLAARVADAVSGLGATVVSGLAVGIDGAAHVATVRAGRVTVAVMGGGHEHLYPAAHRGLASSIVARGGAVISEFAPDVVPSRGTFPRRNRIISGLADATVVVEAGLRSGALTTAAWALEQGRGLHLVPGRVGDPSVAGCLAFLREAAPEARIVAGVPELLEDLGLLGGQRAERPEGRRGAGPQPELDALLAAVGPVERALAQAIARGNASVDELAVATGQPGATVLGALTSLEVRGLVVEAFGRYRPAGPLAVGARPVKPARARARDRTNRAA